MAEPIQFLSGSRHPDLSRLQDFLNPPEVGHLLLPSTILLLNDRPELPLSRQPVYGVDLVIPSSVRVTHFLVVGTTGSGKNNRVIDPFRFSCILQPESIVVSFIQKAGDFGAIQAACRLAGKKLHVVNLDNCARSLPANFLDIDDQNRVIDLIRRFADLAGDPNRRDTEFWSDCCRTALLGCWQSGIRSLPAMLAFYSGPRERVVKNLKESGNDDLMGLAAFIQSGSHNAETVLATIRGILGIFRGPDISQVMGGSNALTLRNLARPAVWQIEINEAKLETLRPLYQILSSIIIDGLIENAERLGRRAPPVTLFFDDLPSLGRLLSIPRLLTLRSRNMGVVAGVQSLASLTELTNNPAAFCEAFASKIVLPGCAQADAEYFSLNSGEQLVIPEIARDGSHIISRRLLSPCDIRSPGHSHYLLGPPATILLGPTTFQAYLQRVHELPTNRQIYRAAFGITGKERLRRGKLAGQQKVRSAWASKPKQNNESPDDLLEKTQWQSASPEARKWWLALLSKNRTRMEQIHQLLVEIANRKSSCEIFYRARLESGSDNLRSILNHLPPPESQ